MRSFIKKTYKFNFKQFGFWLLFIFSLILSSYGGYLKYTLNNHKINKIKLDHFVINTPPAPTSLKATSYLVGDLKTGNILLSKNEDLHLFPASISKLMTGIITIDNLPLEKEIEITPYMVSAEGEEGGLKVGEILTVKDLLKILLISSSNDAAIALSDTLNKRGVNFVDLMNEKAKQIGLYNTAYFGETGLDRKGNFTTVKDLFKLSQEIYKNYPLLGDITQKSEEIVLSKDGKIIHNLKNTNILTEKLPYLWLGKTGSTPDAKDCLLSIFEFPKKNDKIVIAIIVLNSTDRFGDTIKLYNWIQNILAAN